MWNHMFNVFYILMDLFSHYNLCFFMWDQNPFFNCIWNLSGILFLNWNIFNNFINLITVSCFINNFFMLLLDSSIFWYFFNNLFFSGFNVRFPFYSFVRLRLNIFNFLMNNSIMDNLVSFNNSMIDDFSCSLNLRCNNRC